MDETMTLFVTPAGRRFEMPTAARDIASRYYAPAAFGHAVDALLADLIAGDVTEGRLLDDMFRGRVLDRDEREAWRVFYATLVERAEVERE